ncbi:hypothetical protein JCM19055_2793 [Geomicrobium sp. JCM 19055]|nr:hypothetical protein JCM19055_2793 [Geomicrobium sp. JCM 19055]
MLLIMYRNAWSPIIQHHTITSTKASKESSFKIAVITDIHLAISMVTAEYNNS